MKNIAFILVFFTSQTVFSDTFSDSDLFFDWAEDNYTQLFSPPNQASQKYRNLYYRYYPGTNNYLGVNVINLGVYIGKGHGRRTYIDTLANLMTNAGLVAVPYPLNDTGQTFCGDENNNDLNCPVANYSNQDAENGRDATHNHDTDGHAGFSFTKLDSSGNRLPANASSWSCVKDNVTGLIWEVKTDDGGLRDKGWEYSWYNSTGINDGGRAGTSNGGDCHDFIKCDTEKFVEQVNTAGLCGATDWRMPHIKELEQLISLDRVKPSIDSNYFPDTLSTYYWTATPDAAVSAYAYTAYFNFGYAYFGNKETSSYPVRLVRPGQ
jgi:hypothetical protein